MSEATINKIELPVSISVRDLAGKLNSNPINVIKVLMANGVMANISQQVDFDTAAVVASELGFEAIQEVLEGPEAKTSGKTADWKTYIEAEDPKQLTLRAPVATILGHVDHGKTTLLDAIRHTNVADGEAGGITQHIGAYQVEHKNQLITFLDTPGHAAFSAMRARGAQGADIVILVVAANDGVMPQTREAIAHAKAANVPIIVALNKIDRPDANPDFVKKQLSELELVPEEWEGNTMVVPVSAKQKTGIEDLLAGILIVSESANIRANSDGKRFGVVIEAERDKAKGVVATILIQNGTVANGDIVVAGTAHGKIKAMFDFKGKKIQKAGPSTPVSILGLSDVPTAGDVFEVVTSERDAKALAETKKKITQTAAVMPKTTLEDFFAQMQTGQIKELNLIIKADVQGSLEPIISSLKDLSKKDAKINILQAGTGNINESDVLLASASKGVVVGFNVQAENSARRLADVEGVSIRMYDIIYRLMEDVEKALKGMLAPEYREEVLGQANVLAVFKISKQGNIAGCRVTSGELRRNGRIRVLRNNEVVHEGDVSSLKREKEDAREVRTGFECGVGIKGFNDIQAGDVLVCYVIEKVGAPKSALLDG